MICSVLIPSRNRFDRLLECIGSICLTAYNTVDFEFLVRLHASDAESVSRARAGELSRLHPNIQFYIGEDYDGYKSLGRFYDELTERAVGDWHWQVNDDFEFELESNFVPWDVQLAGIPNSGFLVQPEFHHLNNSRYRFDPRGPGPIYPAGSPAKFGLPNFPVDIDTATYNALVVNGGWKVAYIHGLHLHHNRKIDATLSPERY